MLIGAPLDIRDAWRLLDRRGRVKLGAILSLWFVAWVLIWCACFGVLNVWGFVAAQWLFAVSAVITFRFVSQVLR